VKIESLDGFLDRYFVTNRHILNKINKFRWEVKNYMADLNQSVEDLKAAVAGVAARVGDLAGPLQAQIAELQATVQTEREAAVTLATAEDQEDVLQNQALADAQAATDAALQAASASADAIQGEVAKLNEVAAPPAV
jgi:chromosome segregation ATPase